MTTDKHLPKGLFAKFKNEFTFTKVQWVCRLGKKAACADER